MSATSAEVSITDNGVRVPAERDRWDDDVVDTMHRTYRWGVTELDVRMQQFADQDIHLEIDAPERPPWAADMVADLLASNHVSAAVGEALRRTWDVGRDELDAAAAEVA